MGIGPLESNQGHGVACKVNTVSIAQLQNRQLWGGVYLKVPSRFDKMCRLVCNQRMVVDP